jgi:hypothetical protein
VKAQETMNIVGRLTLQARDRSGRLLDQLTANNSIVLTGRDLVAKLFVHENIGTVSHVGVGTGTAPVNPSGNTALAAELFRKQLRAVDPTTDLTVVNGTNVKVTLNAELDFGEGNGALTEAGLFNAAAGGVLYNRVVFPPINKTTDFKLALIWEIVF